MKKRFVPVLLALLLTGCAAQRPQAVPALLEPVGLQFDTAFVQRGEISEMEAFDFAVVPETEELYFTCDGVLDEVCVQVGDEVTKGQALLKLDVTQQRRAIAEIDRTLDYTRQNNAYALQLLQMDIDLCKYEMENRDYKEEGERAQLKENELRQRESALAQEKERQALELAQMQEQRAQLQMVVDQSVMYALFDGQVIYLPEIFNGSGVQNGQTLVVLADFSRLKLKGTFISQAAVEGAADVYALVGGERAEIAYEPMDSAEYVSLLLSGEEMDTRFTFQGGAPAGVRAGDYAAVIVKNMQRQDVLYIPPNCLYRDGEGDYVYVAQEGARKRVSVTVGLRNTTAAEIKEGLSEGDEVYVKE